MLEQPRNLAVILFPLMKNSGEPVRLLLIEDDELSREVLTLQIAAQGYVVETAESGDDALWQLERPESRMPNAVLTDLQMPGPSGQELLNRLRATSDAGQTPRMVILAMSASQPYAELLSGFDGFLLKPFTMQQLAEALETEAESLPGSESQAAVVPGADFSLNETVFRRLAESMPAAQLQQLYALCIDDATARIDRMRLAATIQDDVEYRKEAHAIKGGCSMVGASELHRLASAAELGGLTAANHVASLDEMLGACERLRRILVARTERATL